MIRTVNDVPCTRFLLAPRRKMSMKTHLRCSAATLFLSHYNLNLAVPIPYVPEMFYIYLALKGIPGLFQTLKDQGTTITREFKYCFREFSLGCHILKDLRQSMWFSQLPRHTLGLDIWSDFWTSLLHFYILCYI